MATKKKAVKKTNKRTYVVVDWAGYGDTVLASGDSPGVLEQQLRNEDLTYDMGNGEEWEFDVYVKYGKCKLKKPEVTLEIIPSK